MLLIYYLNYMARQDICAKFTKCLNIQNWRAGEVWLKSRIEKMENYKYYNP